MIVFIFNSCATLNHNQRLDFDKDDVYYESSDYFYYGGFGPDNDEEHIFCIEDLRFRLRFMGNQKSVLYSPFPVIPILPYIGKFFNRNEDGYKILKLYVYFDVFNEQDINIPTNKIKIILKDTVLYTLESKGDFTNNQKLRYRKSSDILLGHFMFSEFRDIGAAYFDIGFDKLEEYGDFQIQIDSVQIDGKYTNITFPKMSITNRLVYRPFVVHTH